MNALIPGEIQAPDETLELNAGRKTIEIEVANSGDRPIQVGSHFGFYETNRALQFERESAFNMRLDIAAGTAVRFEPGETKTVTLVEIGGAKKVFGLNGLSAGASTCSESRERLNDWEKL